jgi:AcrR family transcriptional regulator
MAAKTGQKEPRIRARKAARGRAAGLSAPAGTDGSDEELRRRSELLWGDPQRSSRGPKPALSRADVVEAAIGIAAEEGLAALTMHAVAKRVGSTMALYRYFPSKEALIDASVDTAMGAPPVRLGPRDGWRDEVKRWAHAKRAMLCSRPWLAELPFVAAPHGPNWLSWHEAFLQTIADTGLSPEDRMDVLSAVHGYVSGSSDTAISLARARSRGISDQQWAQAVSADLCRAINDPRYPLLSAILTSASGGISAESPLPARAGRPRTLDEGFDFGLERLLDGIQDYMNSLDLPASVRSQSP